MKALIQRAKGGAVTINEKEKRSMQGAGLVILVGITHSDSLESADFLAEKCAMLRIFEDDQGKMNLSLLDTHKRALIISQFTLYADTVKGRRPSFTQASRPEHAIPIYERFINAMKALGIDIITGEFGADMLVEIQNDGPVTIMLETPTREMP